MKSKMKEKSEVVVPEVGKVKWVHGKMTNVPIEDIEPNPWNPNEMSPEEFNMLSENVVDAGFLDPVLVVPLPKKDGERQRYRIIDGEHRFEQQRLMDVAEVPCIIADPDRIPEKEQMRQTVRMNKIRGKLNIKKFAKLANLMMEMHGVPYEELAHEFGFVDESELEEMMDRARESLPSEEAKRDFDKARDEIKTVDDLSLVLNRLFSKYGDTLPAHFMILDFGGKEHLWVRLQKQDYKKIVDKARLCLEHGVTFDSVLCLSLTMMDVRKFVEKNKDLLEEAKLEEKPETIDDLT